MQIIKKIFFLFILSSLLFTTVNAADTTQAPTRIAVLIPLNLDSAFNGYEYKLNSSKISQFFLSGLDFYNGVMMAVDSLQKENTNIEVWIYDLHKANQSVAQITNAMQRMNFSLIIAFISSSYEQKIISDFSAKNSIPVVSETFPNDAYLNNNPFFLIVNPTWQTHINAIYDYLAKNFRGKKIHFFTRRGSLEDRIAQQINTLNSKRLVSFSTIILNDNFTDADVLKNLDSTQQNIILCGSLNEYFGKSLIKTLNAAGSSYNSLVVGMPTWTGMGGITGSNTDKLQIMVTSPYNYEQNNSFISTLSDEYKATHFSRPSDMVYKGFESMYHFTKLLLANPDSFINESSSQVFTVSNEYNFQPIRLTPTSFIPDYLENKKIYFIKIVNGQIQSIE
ncbi:MAG: hypothetical protein JST21_09925 [Bacteroidetes bacterium]|nr:hypothetical protein [Bacteroidota bacterium]